MDLAGVGANLQDHPVVPLLWHTHGITDLAQLNNVRNFARWKVRGTGPLASNIGEAGAFFASRDGLPAPDLQIHMAPAGFYDNGLHEPTHAMVTAAPTLVSIRQSGPPEAALGRPDLTGGLAERSLSCPRLRSRPGRRGGDHRVGQLVQPVVVEARRRHVDLEVGRRSPRAWTNAPASAMLEANGPGPASASG